MSAAGASQGRPVGAHALRPHRRGCTGVGAPACAGAHLELLLPLLLLLVLARQLQVLLRHVGKLLVLKLVHVLQAYVGCRHMLGGCAGVDVWGVVGWGFGIWGGGGVDKLTVQGWVGDGAEGKLCWVTARSSTRSVRPPFLEGLDSRTGLACMTYSSRGSVMYSTSYPFSTRLSTNGDLATSSLEVPAGGQRAQARPGGGSVGACREAGRQLCEHVLAGCTAAAKGGQEPPLSAERRHAARGKYGGRSRTEARPQGQKQGQKHDLSCSPTR